MKSETLRRMWALCAGALIFAAGSSARAQDAGGMACLNDIDCPDPACGGQVCDYSKGAICVPAGAAKKGMDGWCTTERLQVQGHGGEVRGMLYARSRFPRMHHRAAARAELADLRQPARVVRQRPALLETRRPLLPLPTAVVAPSRAPRLQVSARRACSSVSVPSPSALVADAARPDRAHRNTTKSGGDYKELALCPAGRTSSGHETALFGRSTSRSRLWSL